MLTARSPPAFAERGFPVAGLELAPNPKVIAMSHVIGTETRAVKAEKVLDMNALDLLEFLQECQALGVDLSLCYLEPIGEPGEIVKARLVEKTLSDASTVHDIELVG